VSRLEIIEGQIKELSREGLAGLREWLARFDAEVWHGRFKADGKAGKLNASADNALRDHLPGLE
jgi:hypothetical protein